MVNNIKVGDEVICIESGFSHSRNEPYYINQTYLVTHTFLSNRIPTIGIENLQNICDVKNFRLKVKEEDLMKNLIIW